MNYLTTSIKIHVSICLQVAFLQNVYKDMNRKLSILTNENQFVLPSHETDQ